jgi:hypothetical protein
VGLLQRIGDCEWVKFKTFQNGLGSFWRLGCKIHPEQASFIAQEAGKVGRGNIGANWLARREENGTNHETYLQLGEIYIVDGKN